MESPKNYATRSDGFIRSLDRLCKLALETGNPLEDGPTSTDLAGALLARPGFSEERLSKNWKLFAERFPANANNLRRGASALRVSKDQPLNVSLPSDTRTVKKFLIVSNPDYVGGVAIAEKDSLESAEKTEVAKPARKRKAARKDSQSIKAEPEEGVGYMNKEDGEI